MKMWQFNLNLNYLTLNLLKTISVLSLFIQLLNTLQKLSLKTQLEFIV